MCFNPDPRKQAVEVCFSRKIIPSNNSKLTFNNANVDTRDTQKHLELILDRRLVFDCHLTEKISVANKCIGLLAYFRKYMQRETLMYIYKSYIRPHLNYGDIIYDHPTNESFIQEV